MRDNTDIFILYGETFCMFTKEDVEIEDYVWKKINPKEIEGEIWQNELAWENWAKTLNL